MNQETTMMYTRGWNMNIKAASHTMGLWLAYTPRHMCELHFM